jgi:hypothetical protein
MFTAPGCAAPCTWSVTNGRIPNGLQLDSATGVLSGTPSGASNTGLTIQASGSNGVSRTPVALYVRPNTPQPIQMPATLLPPTTIRDQYTVSQLPNGGEASHMWALIAGALPQGLDLVAGELVSNNTTPDVSYIAGVLTEIGTSSFTLEVTDSAGATASAAFSILVSPLRVEYRSLPLFGSTLRYNESYQQRMLAIGGSGAYSWGPVGQMLPGLSIAASDLVSGAPSNTGSFSVPLAVTDLGTADQLTQLVNVNVASASGATLTIDNGPNLGTFAQGLNGSMTLTARGAPPSPPPVFTFSLAPGSTLPPGFALVSGDSLPGGFRSTSTQLIRAGGNRHVHTLEVRDQNNNFKTLTVTVSPHTIFTNTSLPDAAPVLYTQRFTWGGGVVWSGQVQRCAGLPLTPDGVLSGMPAADSNFSLCPRAMPVPCRDQNVHAAPLKPSRSPISVLTLQQRARRSRTLRDQWRRFSAFSIVPQPNGSLGCRTACRCGQRRVERHTNERGLFTFTVAVTMGVDGRQAVYAADRDAHPIPSPSFQSGSIRGISAGQSCMRRRHGGRRRIRMIGRDPPGFALYGAALPTNGAPGSAMVAGASTVAGSSHGVPDGHRCTRRRRRCG